MRKIIIFLTLLSTATVSSAYFWTKAYHEAEHTVNHVTHTITHQANVLKNKDIPVVTHTITHQAGVLVHKDLPVVVDKVLKPACRLGIGAILGKVIGKACEPAVTDFTAECIAELETETEGMATTACTSAAFVLQKGCSHVLSKPVADLAEDEVCGK